MEVFHCDQKLVRDIEGENRFRRSSRRSVPGVQNGSGEIPPGTGLQDGLAHFINVMTPATLNEVGTTQPKSAWGGFQSVPDCRQ